MSQFIWQITISHFGLEFRLPICFLDLIAERLRREDLWQHEPEWQHYYGLNGTPDLLNVTANFLQERLAKVKPWWLY